MKKLILILLLAAAVIPFQNCKDNTTEDPTPTPKDTTKTTVKPTNTFKFNGVETYNLVWDSTLMTGYYKVSNNRTSVYITGYSSSSGTQNRKVDIILSFQGKATGTFKYLTDPVNNFEITITRNGIDTKYIYDNGKPSNDMIINITKYDPVGGRIKGTFSGNLANGITTATITAGAFEVVRGADE